MERTSQVQPSKVIYSLKMMCGTKISVSQSYTDNFNNGHTISSDHTDTVENVNDMPLGAVTILRSRL